LRTVQTTHKAVKINLTCYVEITLKDEHNLIGTEIIIDGRKTASIVAI